MSQSKAKPGFKALAVVDFTCDQCGIKLPVVCVVEGRAIPKIKKVYHESCWRLHVAANRGIQRSN